MNEQEFTQPPIAEIAVLQAGPQYIIAPVKIGYMHEW